MSMIVPAGNKNVSWSPKAEVLTKVASTDAVAQEEVNPLYEAAKKYAESLGIATENCEKCSKTPCECSEVAPSEVTSIEVTPTDKKEVVEVAVQKIEEAVGELKDAVCDEVEIDIDIGEPNEVSEVEIEIPGEKVNGGEIIVESEPKCACATASANPFAAKSDAKSDSASSDTKGSSDAKSDTSSSDKKEAKTEIVMEKSANAEEKFVKLSMLSKENRKKLMDYWVNMEQFPKDYVALMVKDYEK